MSEYAYPACVRLDVKFFFRSESGKMACVGQKWIQDPPTRDQLREMAKEMQGQLAAKFNEPFKMMSVQEVDDYIEKQQAND